MNKFIKIGLKILVSAVFLLWVIFKVDWPQVLFYLRMANPWILVLYVGVILLGIAISSYKWMFLSHFKNIKHPYGDYYKLYLTGTFINNFMPSFIGGDTFKAYQIGKAEKKYIEAASVVVMDRVTGLIGIMAIALIFNLANLQIVMSNQALLFFSLFIMLSLAWFIFVVKSRNARFWRWILAKIPQKLAKFIEETQEFSADYKVLAKAILWGAIFQVVGVAIANLLLFWALGIHINILSYLSVIFLVCIVSAIPISINNIGIQEWAYVTFFGLFGIDPAAVVTVAILSRFIQMVISFFALPTYLRSKK